MTRSELALVSRFVTGSRQVHYRTRQFWQGLTAQVHADEMVVVAFALPKAAVCLFIEMPVDAQRHSLNVLYALQRVGHADPALAAAALLHDVGKIAAPRAGTGISLWRRGLLVLLQTVRPELLQRLADADPAAGWHYAVHVQLNHARIGAAMAEQAGCDPLTCWLIAHHQDADPADPRSAAGSLSRARSLLTLLQWSDRCH